LISSPVKLPILLLRQSSGIPYFIGYKVTGFPENYDIFSTVFYITLWECGKKIFRAGLCFGLVGGGGAAVAPPCMVGLRRMVGPHYKKNHFWILIVG
jgi:hypothetical protein